MPIIKSKPYLYGADADGNRGVMVSDYTIISDYSGEDITNEKEIYLIDKQFMSHDEFLFFCGVQKMEKGWYPILDANYELDAQVYDVYYIEFLDSYVDEDGLSDFCNIHSHRLYDLDLEKYSKGGDYDEEEY